MSNTPNRTASEETIHKALAALAEKHGMSEAEVLRQALAFKDALDGAVPPPASEAGEALEAVERGARLSASSRLIESTIGIDLGNALPALRRAVAERDELQVALDAHPLFSEREFKRIQAERDAELLKAACGMAETADDLRASLAAAESATERVLRVNQQAEDRIEQMEVEGGRLRTSLLAAESALTERSNEVAALKARCEELDQYGKEIEQERTEWIESSMSATTANAALKARVAELEAGLRNLIDQHTVEYELSCGHGYVNAVEVVHVRMLLGPSPVDPELPAPGEGDGAEPTCPDCGCPGAHFCTGRREYLEPPGSMKGWSSTATATPPPSAGTERED